MYIHLSALALFHLQMSRFFQNLQTKHEIPESAPVLLLPLLPITLHQILLLNTVHNFLFFLHHNILLQKTCILIQTISKILLGIRYIRIVRSKQNSRTLSIFSIRNLVSMTKTPLFWAHTVYLGAPTNTFCTIPCLNG